ncbi:MAG: family radical protein [Herbinix sp.]|jgi:radical SAM protein (TIGR01212 family)|nr:family radical protein [Herbinix sp.]
MQWGDRRYHSLDYEMKQIYGNKVYKISLNGGMSCPNRDGTLDSRGCIFCSEGGSGDFASSSCKTINDQIEDAKLLVAGKLSKDPNDHKFIAYFQAYTNTYGPMDYLHKIFYEAINHPDVVILSIATRPDCLGDDVLDLLAKLNRIKPVWIELGLQTIHEDTARYLRRGYPLPVFDSAVHKLHSIGISVIVHAILGLPGENKENVLQTIDYISSLPIQGVKLQLLHILKGTDLGLEYENGFIPEVLSLDEYIDYVISCLEHLPEHIIIHRITGDGPKRLLLAPLWSSNKKLVLNKIHQTMKERDTWQGKYDTSHHEL